MLEMSDTVPHSCTVMDEVKSCGRPSQFQLLVGYQNGPDMIERSYEDFENLDSNTSVPPDVRLPLTPRCSFLAMISPAVCKRRRANLQDYLSNIIVHKKEASNCEALAVFLGKRSQMRTRGLAAKKPETENGEDEDHAFDQLPSVGTWLRKDVAMVPATQSEDPCPATPSANRDSSEAARDVATCSTKSEASDESARRPPMVTRSFGFAHACTAPNPHQIQVPVPLSWRVPVGPLDVDPALSSYADRRDQFEAMSRQSSQRSASSRPLTPRQDTKEPEWPAVGDKVEARWFHSRHWYPASIAEVRDDGTYLVDWVHEESMDRIKAKDDIRPAKPEEQKATDEAEKEKGPDKAEAQKESDKSDPDLCRIDEAHTSSASEDKEIANLQLEVERLKSRLLEQEKVNRPSIDEEEARKKPSGGKNESRTASPARTTAASTTPASTTRTTHMLICALDYVGSASPLTCTIDGKNMHALAKACGIADVETMYNEQCTREEITAAIRRTAQKCALGDTFLFFFAGHGASSKDDNGDEKDGFDENYVCDFTNQDLDPSKHYLCDDDFSSLLTSCLSPQVHIIVISDCCHSGSVCDFKKPMWNGYQAVSISGCKDSQTAGDTGKGGICTHSLMLAIEQLQKEGRTSYSVRNLHEKTVYYDSTLMKSEQDIKLTKPPGCKDLAIPWPLIPKHPFAAPYKKNDGLLSPRNGTVRDQSPSRGGMVRDQSRDIAKDLHEVKEDFLRDVVQTDTDIEMAQALLAEDVRAKKGLEAAITHKTLNDLGSLRSRNPAKDTLLSARNRSSTPPKSRWTRRKEDTEKLLTSKSRGSKAHYQLLGKVDEDGSLSPRSREQRSTKYGYYLAHSDQAGDSDTAQWPGQAILETIRQDSMMMNSDPSFTSNSSYYGFSAASDSGFSRVSSSVPQEPSLADRVAQATGRMPGNQMTTGNQLTLCSLTLSCGNPVPGCGGCYGGPTMVLGKGQSLNAASGMVDSMPYHNPFADEVVPAREAQARALNEQILNALAGANAAAIFKIYEHEDPIILWEAYKDLLDNILFETESLEKFEADWQTVIPDHDFEEFVKRRPDLQGLLHNMARYRSRRQFISAV